MPQAFEVPEPVAKHIEEIWKENNGLKAENKRLKEKIDKIRDEDNGPYSVKAQIAFRESLSQIIIDKQEQIEKLCNFLGGNFDSEEEVKKILKDHYSEEFIKTNTERWGEVGIDFEEKEEYVPTGSKVDMEQFQKLMQSGMVPWASKKSGEEE